MTLSLGTAYRSFGGEVEASSTPTICRLPDSRRHQLWAIALRSANLHSVSIQERHQHRFRFLWKYRKDVVLSIPVWVEERSAADLHDLTFHPVSFATSAFEPND